MQRNCVRCGKPFEAKRSTAKYCGSTCRSAQSLRPVGQAPTAEPASGRSPLVAMVRAELEVAGRLGTARGQMALELAAAYGSPFDNGSQKASLMRELRATVDAALEGAKIVDDPLDELKARRDRKLGG